VIHQKVLEAHSKSRQKVPPAELPNTDEIDEISEMEFGRDSIHLCALAKIP